VASQVVVFRSRSNKRKKPKKRRALRAPTKTVSPLPLTLFVRVQRVTGVRRSFHLYQLTVTQTDPPMTERQQLHDY
jgi:hypothetical protein